MGISSVKLSQIHTCNPLTRVRYSFHPTQWASFPSHERHVPCSCVRGCYLASTVGVEEASTAWTQWLRLHRRRQRLRPTNVLAISSIPRFAGVAARSIGHMTAPKTASKSRSSTMSEGGGRAKGPHNSGVAHPGLTPNAVTPWRHSIATSADFVRVLS